WMRRLIGSTSPCSTSCASPCWISRRNGAGGGGTSSSGGGAVGVSHPTSASPATSITRLVIVPPLSLPLAIAAFALGLEPPLLRCRSGPSGFPPARHHQRPAHHVAEPPGRGL